MQRFLRLIAIAAVAAAMVAVPAAAARSGGRVRLSVLPLPASSLGSAARSLRLQPEDSGVISNESFHTSRSPMYPNRWEIHPFVDPATLGRVSGYALDYGLGTGGAGITEVWTSVDKYKTSADAKNKGLAFRKQSESSAGFSLIAAAGAGNRARMDRKLAKALVLAPSDLPTGLIPGPTGQPETFVRYCLARTGFKVVAWAGSPTYHTPNYPTNPYAAVDSVATVLKTTPEARRYYRYATKRLRSDCSLKYWQPAEEPGPPATVGRLRNLSFPRYGDQSGAWRRPVSFVTDQFNLDVIVVREGRAVLVDDFIVSNGWPPQDPGAPSGLTAAEVETNAIGRQLARSTGNGTTAAEQRRTDATVSEADRDRSVAGAVVAVPAAAARSGARVRLSVLPLPASSLGPAARSLPLQADSGFLDHTRIDQPPLYPNRWGRWDFGPKLSGHVSGYALDYGRGASGGAGITEVWTSVDSYKTNADATKALAEWKWEELSGNLFAELYRGVFEATPTVEKAAPLKTRRFAVLVAYRAPNIVPLFGLDDQFTVGRYEADVTVWAGSAAAAKKLAPRMAKKLDTRIKQALAGRLHAKPVELPSKSELLPGTPDLKPLELQVSDLGEPFSVLSMAYGGVSGQFSLDWIQIYPAGQFSTIDQYIYWYPTANEASFADDTAYAFHGPRSLLDLGSVSVRAWGVQNTPGHVQWLDFSSGQIREVIDGAGGSPSQAESFAQIVANKINAAGFGS